MDAHDRISTYVDSVVPPKAGSWLGRELTDIELASLGQRTAHVKESSGDTVEDCRESCTYFKAFVLAKSVVEANESDIFNQPTQLQKLGEFGVIQTLFDKVIPACHGPNRDSGCSSAQVINEARGLIFGVPMIDIARKSTNSVGFGISRQSEVIAE